MARGSTSRRAGPGRTGPDVPAPDVPEHGLLVYRASRLEALLDPLCALLDAYPPDGLLQPAELITAHPGMRRWLLNELARRAGVSYAIIHRFAAGDRDILLETASKIAGVLDVELRSRREGRH